MLLYLHATLLDIFPPIMHILESQHLLNLPITQRCLLLSHLPRELHARTFLFQELLRAADILKRDRVVRSIKHLEP